MKLLFIILGLGGFGAICCGAWLIYQPLGLVVSGIVVLVLAQGWSRVYNSRKKGR